MYALKGKVFSHNSIKNNKCETLIKVASSKPLYVNTYDELMKNIAIIANKNKNLFPLFRGQKKDYLVKEKGRECSSIISSFDRPSKTRQVNIRKNRIEALKNGAEYFQGLYHQKKEFKKYKELIWAIFQHYEVMPTPFVDLTQSLLTACSFASLDNDLNSAVIYMFGFENLNSDVYYSHFGEYQLIKLLSVVPEDAKRPLYQDGYLVTTFPLDLNKSRPLFNLRNHLLAKFEFNPNLDSGFWGNLKPWSKEFLYPKDDKILININTLKQKYEELF